MMLTRTFPLVLAVLLLGGCSSAKPVLYLNAYLKTVGKEAAESDIQDCQKMAEAAGAEQGTDQAGQVAGSTAVGAGVGAAGGAVGGAISGAAGAGSVIGAASGAVWGLLMGLWNASTGSSQPSQAYANVVNRCLQDKGYEVGGWN